MLICLVSNTMWKTIFFIRLELNSFWLAHLFFNFFRSPFFKRDSHELIKHCFVRSKLRVKLSAIQGFLNKSFFDCAIKCSRVKLHISHDFHRCDLLRINQPINLLGSEKQPSQISSVRSHHESHQIGILIPDYPGMLRGGLASLARGGGSPSSSVLCMWGGM